MVVWFKKCCSCENRFSRVTVWYVLRLGVTFTMNPTVGLAISTFSLVLHCVFILKLYSTTESMTVIPVKKRKY